MADNMKENTNQLIPLIVGVSIFCLLLVLFVFAWTGPSGAPPGSNAPAPINVGSFGQEKEGQLGISIPSGEFLDGGYGLTVGTASNPLGIKTSGDSYFRQDLTAGGNVGIGGTHLVYDSASGVIDWGSAGSGNLYLRTLSTQGDINTYTNRLTILNNGCVHNYGTCVYGSGMSTYVMNTDHLYESGNDGGQISLGTTNAEVSIRGSVLFDCPSCGSTSALDGSGDWGDMTVQGRVLSANSNIHLSPPGGYNVVINDSYRAAGGGTSGAAGLSVEGDITMGSKTRYYSLNASDFTAAYPSTDPHTISVYYIRSDWSSVTFRAPIHLPHNAVVTEIKVDGAGTGETWSLTRVPRTGSGAVLLAYASIGTADTSISYSTINNYNYSYVIWTSPLESGEKIYGGYIKYTITSPYP